MENDVARKIENLPRLKEGYARGVHLTGEDNAENIANFGLDYKSQGMISSTARFWSSERDVDYQESKDPRFSGKHIRAVIIDMPFEELKLHDWRTGKPGPGIVPKEYIVGIVLPRKFAITDELFRDYVAKA